MGQKTNNRILWHGNGLNAEGKAVAPVKAVAGGDGTDGLNEGELYICNSDSDPALFILTDAGNVVRIDGNGSDTYTRAQINEKLNAKVDVAFFSRLFGLMDEEGGEIQVNDVETLASSIKAKLGFWTEQYISAKGLNPDSGATPGGSTTLAGLTDVSITGTPTDGQVLAFDAALNKWKPTDAATAGLDEGQLAKYLTANNYAKKTDITAALAGYATQTWASGQFALKTVAINAGTGLTGGGTLSASRTLSLATVGTAGTYTKVTVDAYGRVTGHGSLTEADIPALSISKITNLQTTLNKKLDKTTFEEMFEKVYVSGYGYAIRAKLAFYSDDWISAKGLNSDAGSTTGGVDENEVLQIVENAGYIKSSALNGYATQSWVTGLGYATQSWVNSQGFLTDAFIPRGQVLNTSVDDLTDIGAYTINENSDLPSGAYVWGTLMTFNSTGTTYATQMYVENGENGENSKSYLRTRYGYGWRAWRTLVETHNIGSYALTPNNYTDYTVTQSGGGASGTWGIGISGNAASATKLQTARTLWGQPFDGTGNVNGTLTVNGGIVLPYASGTWLSMATRGDLIRGSVAQSSGGAHSLFRVTAYNGNVLAFGGLGNDVGFYGYSKANIDNNTNNSSFRAIWNMDNGNFTFSNNLTVGGSLLANAYVQVGGGRIYWDSANNALYVQKSDGTSCGFYATGFVSAKGANSDASSAVAGVTELSELEDVTISSPANGQALVYRNGVWKNETVSGGGGTASVAWADVTGKPSWIGSTKPSYSFSEITGTPSISISSSSGTNLSVTVEGSGRTIPDLYATYLGGTTKQGLFTGLTYSGNRLSVTIGGTTRSVTISGGSSTIPDTLALERLDIEGTANSSAYISANYPNNMYINVGGDNLMTFDGDNTVVTPGSAVAGVEDFGSSRYRWRTIYSVNSLNTSSDLRLKDVRAAIPLTVAQVAAAPSFLYRWKNGADTALHAGSSAQYWQQALPQAVTEGADGYLAMEYDRIALAAAIATARAVETLDQRVTRLEKENARLRRRLRRHKINV